MYIALEKKKTNVVEYVLYMWQVENIIRACKFDIAKIEQTVLNHLGVNENEKALAKDWYLNLIQEMNLQGLEQSGHRSQIMETVAELSLLHTTLLKTFEDQKYSILYNNSRGDISDLMMKQKEVKNEIEACFNGLYGMWMLKISKKEISSQTQHSIDKIGKLMVQLAQNYHKKMN
jgi:hypothetical protein|tara:strand:- start:44 stop:568 length:525 start_codon:yes stop_codon:yes gene_type:complete